MSASRWPGVVVVLVALGTHAWVASLQFQYCDYDDIPDVGWMLGVEPMPESQPGGLPARSLSYLPVFWAVLWGLRQVGSHALPWVFHGFFICSHAAASWLLYRIISDRVGRLAGLIGGLLFAILPGGSHAVTWIAAGGHQLSVLFMLAAGFANDHALRTRSRLGAVPCALATFCAVLSKETAVALLPALAIVWLIPPAGVLATPRRRTIIGVLSLAEVAAAWLLRVRVMGVWIPDFPGGTRLGLSHAAVLPRAFLGFLLPWNRGDEVSSLAPMSIAFARRWFDDAALSTGFRAAVAVAALLPIVIGFAAAGSRARLALLAVLAALIAAIVPVLPLSPPGVHLSRAWYPASAVFSALVAGASLRSTKRGAAWACALLVPLGALSLDGLGHVARTELHVASAIQSATADLERTVRAAPDERFVLLDPPDMLAQLAFLGLKFGVAVSPPFGTVPSPVHDWPSARSLSHCPAIFEEDRTLQVLAWDGRRLAPRGPALPAIPRDLPALVADETRPGVFRPRDPVPPRGIAGIRLSAHGASSRGVLTWMAGAESRAVPFAFAEGAETVVGFPEAAFDESWVTSPVLEGVRIEGVELDGPPALLRRLPAIEIRSPVRRGFLFLGVPPRFVFASPIAAPAFRLTFEFILPDDVRVPVAWTFASSEAPADSDGNHILVADQPAAVIGGGAGRMTWTEIATRLAPEVTGRGWGLGLDARIEALDASRLDVIARSESRRLVLIRKP